MRKVKIFKSIESELIPLEDEINSWLADNGAELVSITGNIAPQTPSSAAGMGSFSASDVLVIVVYDDGKK